MKQVLHLDLQRLDQKINLLNDKIDRIMEVQGIQLVKEESAIQKEDEKKRKTRERKQAELLRKEQFQRQLDQIIEDRNLKMEVGGDLMRQFNLVQPPSASRIRDYQKTKNPSAFDGLKRVNS